MARKPVASEARQRILETADRLFYQEGIRAVGIDRIIAEAGVAKMSLYKHFPSKDELILAVLKHREESVLEFFRSAMERHGKRKNTLRAFFAALKDLIESPEFRGCPFQNAAVELADPSHPGAKFVRGHKQRFSEFLRGLVEEMVGSKAAAKIAPAVTILVEGALVTAVIQGNADAADAARDAALKLVGPEKGAEKGV